MIEINAYKLKISQLRALIAVADCGNFSEAALKLDVSQSAISHAIASLEEELGVILLLRGRHGAHLTPVGERIVAQARQVLQLLEAIVKEADREKGLHGGQVRIATFRSVATHVLPGVMARFLSNLPEIAVTITEHADYLGVEQALREGRADIGFTYLPAGEEFQTWEILRDEYIVLLPPNSELRNAQLTWEQLRTYPLILPPMSNACHLRIHHHLRTLGFPIKAAYEVNEDSTIVSMVEQGLGAAILPRLAAEPLPKNVFFYSLPVPLERIIGAAILRNTLQTPAVFAFLDALRNKGQFNNKVINYSGL
ncbi:MAG TPA: LysR family transcriptional regulator, partial [Cyanobacteria bacterium UBA8803]|nr:LysR family transcriptional regulator [Cyanobacteria bacterium UBA9273]HBL60993.1 LysR family transcriptional regulator [Cyanobacteria bacterium UBA8803]